jgi:large subunit ribosomal protein L4
MKSLGITSSSLFIVGVIEKNLKSAAGNVPNVELKTGLSVNTYDVLKYSKLIFSKEGFAQVEARLAKKP